MKVCCIISKKYILATPLCISCQILAYISVENRKSSFWTNTPINTDNNFKVTLKIVIKLGTCCW